jgi:hypothetical protein
MRFILFVLFLVTILSVSLQAQKIKIQSSLWSEPTYSVDNSGPKKLEKNMTEFKSLIGKCPVCLDNLDSYNSKSTASEIFGFIGGACLGWPIGGYLGGRKWLDYYTPMMIGGGVSIVVGLIFAASAGSSLEDLEQNFNNQPKNGVSILFFKNDYCSNLQVGEPLFTISYKF